MSKKEKWTIEYGSTLYRTKSLKDAIRRYRRVLNKVLELHPEIVGLVSTGSSGSILAGALMNGNLPYDFIHIHVNKPGEGHSHTGSRSGIRYISGDYIFVDDFISTLL